MASVPPRPARAGRGRQPDGVRCPPRRAWHAHRATPARRVRRAHAVRDPDPANRQVIRHFEPQARILRMSPGSSRGSAVPAGDPGRTPDRGPADRFVHRRGRVFAEPEARALARIGFANHFAGSLLLPYGRFLVAAESLRYDIDLLSGQFDVSFESVCHRLSTMQRADPRRIPFFFVRVERAGQRLEAPVGHRFPFLPDRRHLPAVERLRGVRATRQGLHPALAHARQPHDPVGGAHRHAPARRLWLAAAHLRGGARLRRALANRLVYSKGIALDDPEAATPIGAGCKVCDREDCAQRASRRWAAPAHRRERAPVRAIFRQPGGGAWGVRTGDRMPRLRSRGRRSSARCWRSSRWPRCWWLVGAVGGASQRAHARRPGRLPGLRAPVTIARDERGTAVVKGANRLDVARGLGFVHAQERFFEMDLARRSAAGELSALFGPVALEHDKTRRMHRMRAMLAARLRRDGRATTTRCCRPTPTASTRALRSWAPGPGNTCCCAPSRSAWQPVDSLLVVGEMFWMLQGSSVEEGFGARSGASASATTVFDWLEPRGGPLGRARSTARVLTPRRDARAGPPRPAQVRPRRRRAGAAAVVARARRPRSWTTRAAPDRHEPIVGSNNWAVERRAQRHRRRDARQRHAPGPGRARRSGSARSSRSAAGTPRSAPRASRCRACRRWWSARTATSPGASRTRYGQWFDWVKVPRASRAGAAARIDETIAVKGGADVMLRRQAVRRACRSSRRRASSAMR